MQNENVKDLIRGSSDEQLAQTLRAAYKEDIKLFASICITEDPHDRDNAFKPFPIDTIPYLGAVLDAYVKESKIVIVKSRQVMITWAFVVAVLWDVMFHSGVRAAIVSKKGDDARKILERIQGVYERLPSWKPKMKFKYFPTARADVEGIKSAIFCFAQGADQLRGDTMSVILSDEFAFQEEQEKTYRSSKPTIDGGGKFVAVSTPNGRNNLFYELAKDPAYHRIDVHWSMNPYKDSLWQQEAFSGISEETRQQEFELNFLATRASRVYNDFNYITHAKLTPFTKGFPLYVGWDWGYNRPAVAFMQIVNNKLRILKSHLGNKIYIDEWVDEVLRLQAGWFPNAGIVYDYCDIDGKKNRENSKSTVIKDVNAKLRKFGRFMRYRKTVDIEKGHDLIRKFMLTMQNGEPCFSVDPTNTLVIDGFQGGYHYHPGKDKPCGCGLNEVNEKEPDYYKHIMDAIRYVLENCYNQMAEAKFKASALPSKPISYDKRYGPKGGLYDPLIGKKVVL